MKKLLIIFALTIPGLSNAADGAVLADLSARLTSLEEQNRQQTGRIEELEYRIKQYEVRINQLETIAAQAVTAAATTATQAESKNPYVSRVGDKNPKYSQGVPEVAPESAAMEEEFDKAFASISAEDYKIAKTQLNDFIGKYPKTDLAGEAYYWLGEISWNERDYNTAAINYLKGYREYPTGNKAAENILKLALTLKELGKKDEACKNLKRFDTEFQDVHVSLKAKATKGMSDLGCS